MKQTLIHGARHSAESFFHTSLGCHKKTVGDGEKLLTYLNSALKALLGFDIFPRGTKKVKFCCLVLSFARKDFSPQQMNMRANYMQEVEKTALLSCCGG